MNSAIWPHRAALDLRRATWLTLAFWAFTFVVFQAPALRNRGVTVWETTGYLIVVLAGFALSLGLYGVIRATQRVPLRPRLVLIAGAAMIAAIGHSIFDHQIFVLCAQLFSIPAKIPPLIEGFVFNILIYVWIYGLYVTIAGLVMTTFVMREQERRLAAATAAAQEAQLAALRFQINPHFLFNTLNAVTTLIGAGRSVEAETVVMRLSDFFRSSLASAPGDLVRLEEELDVAGSYLDIEAARFGDRMSVDIDLPDSLRSAQVPHFLLQPLVENAVKHGVARAKHPVKISIVASTRDGRLIVSISDDAGGAFLPEPAANGAGVGLNNVKARIETLFGPSGVLRTSSSGGAFIAQIEIPLIADRRAAA